MNKRIKNLGRLSCFIVFALIPILFSCEKGPIEVSPIAATSVTLSESSLTLTSGESATLTATVSPDDATDKTVVWSSTDPSVATVSNGKVTALSVGRTTIIATCGSVKGECVVTVERKKPEAGGSEGTEDEEW